MGNIKPSPYRLCVAPMMDWTDRHDRFFLRLISPSARLYTEMVTAPAILHGERDRLLGYSPHEQPLALQLGGADPGELAVCAKVAQSYGYQEINLSVGCPSDRVQSGKFGACLMLEPELVRACVDSMSNAVSIPVTVKCRIGVDDQDPAVSLFALVEGVVSAGVRTIIVHARKAWLQGLSPKENRDIPPLDYSVVYELKSRFPDLTVVINGGITDVHACNRHLHQVDGVMLGRVAYQTPYILAEVERALVNPSFRPLSRREVALRFVDYAWSQHKRGVPTKSMTRHILGLFHGEPGARLWRRHLSENSHLPGATPRVINEALDAMDNAGLKSAA